jgi:hypothetical protein
MSAGKYIVTLSVYVENITLGMLCQVYFDYLFVKDIPPPPPATRFKHYPVNQ